MFIVPHGLCLSVCTATRATPRVHLNSASTRPRAAPVIASLRRRLSAEYCETSCVHLLCSVPTSAECFEAPPPHLRCIDFLLNVARLLCLTCRGLHSLPARLSLHALSSQARRWFEVRTIMFFTIPAISGNFCNTESQAQLDINGH